MKCLYCGNVSDKKLCPVCAAVAMQKVSALKAAGGNVSSVILKKVSSGG